MRRFTLCRGAGFTLAETLIVIGIIGILAIVAIPNFFPRSTRGALDSATQRIVATLREAASRSAAQEGGTTWGVHLENVTGTAPFYALFKTSYGAANTVGYYPLPYGVSFATSSIALGSSTDITFAQISGIPSATSSITINLTVGAATSATILVHPTGLISLNDSFAAGGSGSSPPPSFGTAGIITDDSNSRTPYAIATDNANTYMYVVGYSAIPTLEWRIEKRRMTDGALCSAVSCGTEFGTAGVVTSTAATPAPLAIAIDSTYMYVAGYKGSAPDWRIEKRRLSDGALCTAANCGTEFGTAGVVSGVTASNFARAIAIDDAYMYVVGNVDVNDWRIEKRRLSDGALCTAANCGIQFGISGAIVGDPSSFAAQGIAIDSSYMYVVGNGVDWRIEKRRLSDGALCTAANCGTEFGTAGVATGATLSDVAYAIIANGPYMYVVGRDDSTDFRIEKRLLATGALCTAANCGTEFGTAGVVTGAAITSAARALAVDGTYMYVAGFEVTPDWRVEKRLLATGALCTAANCGTEFGTAGAVTFDSASDFAYGIAIDSTYMYVVGDNTDPTWRIERRRLTDGKAL